MPNIKINWIEERSKIEDKVKAELSEKKENITLEENEPIEKPNIDDKSKKEFKKVDLSVNAEEEKKKEIPDKPFDVDEYIKQIYDKIPSESKQINIKDLQSKYKVKKQRKFDFSYKNPFGNMIGSPYYLAGGIISLLILQQFII